MKFTTYLKSKLRYLFGIAMIAALLSQLISPFLSAKADSPRFNFLSGDYQILEGLNSTKGEDVWKNPVSGDAGDEFRGSVYYHNGMVDTTATNTKIKVNIPAATSGKSAKITASISADNAETVTSTIVDGTLVGANGLTVNLDKDAELDLVPGSVKWYPNSSTSTPGASPTALPFGQSGNEIIGAGVNIGDIQGCWQYAGFVTFAFKTRAKVNPAATIEKTVRNVTKGSTNFEKEVTANMSDSTEFMVEVKNTGDVNMTGATLKDIKPAGLEFAAGSLKKASGGVVIDMNDSDANALFNAGIVLNTIAPGQTVTFLYKTEVTDPLKRGDTAVNKAYLTAFGDTLESTAAVKILAELTPNIVKHKSAFNDTKKVEAQSVSASIGDSITYTLVTSNTGNVATEYEISDDIMQVLQSTFVTGISDGGQVTGNEIKWSKVNIAPDEKVIRTFNVKVKTVANGTKFVNTYGDTVTIIVEVPVVKTPVLHIEKLVRNVTTNDGAFVKSNQAFAGDTLEYLINFSNTGNGPADRVKISDCLPANTEYLASTTRISRNGGFEQTVVDGIAGSGIILDSIPAGETDFIKFRVITSATLAAGQVLTNTVTIENLSDTASTTIVEQPAIPVATPTLPKTGATGGASFMITMLAGIAFLYGNYRKLGLSGETEIIKSLLA